MRTTMHRYTRTLQSAKQTLALALAAALVGCTTVPSTRVDESTQGREATRSQGPTPQFSADTRANVANYDRAIEDRILALDPDRISEDDVRTVLAAGPTPQIILVHGGVFPVYLMMESFANFLAGMGYPIDKIRDPHDGAYSQGPYGDSERLAGETAWYYERDGVRPMMIGHSQGGMQTVKVLHDLSGDYARRIAVWNPLTDRQERRYSIVDPLTHRERPVVGLSISYASAVGSGGVEFLAPAQWALAGRLRAIPDSVDEFTGFSIAGDIIAWTSPSGASDEDVYHKVGNAVVRNVNLPASYSHVFVPATQHLAGDPRMRAWINAYSVDNPETEADVPQGNNANALWAADVWTEIKKHWCLDAQRFIQAKRGIDAGSRTQSAQR